MALALFLSWTLSRTELPGLAYDETIFVRAALAGDYPDRSFVHRDVLGVPVLLMPYVGALKSWAYAPIFAALGVSVETIRIPVVLLSAGTILLAFALAKRLFGVWPAVFLAVLLSTDVAFAVMVKADWGPTAIGAFLRVLALLAYFAFTRSGSAAAAWVLAASLGLGVFNKLDFLVFTVALVAAAGAVDRDRIAAAVRRRPVATLVPLVLLGAWLAVAALVLALPASRLEVSGADEPWGAHLRNLAELLGVSLSGEGQYEWMTGTGLARAAWLSAVFVAALAAVVAVLVRRLRAEGVRGDRERRAITVLLVTLLVVLAGLAVTREVGGSHHVVLLWPLPYLLAAAAIRRPGAGRVAAVAFAAVAVGSHVYVGAAYERAYAGDEPWSPTWTPEIYAVADAVERADPDRVATVDWGVGQLFALVDEPARERFIELWGPLDSLGPGAAADAFAAEHLRRGRVVLVGRRDRGSAPGAGERLDDVLSAVGRSRVRTLFAGGELTAVLIEN